MIPGFAFSTEIWQYPRSQMRARVPKDRARAFIYSDLTCVVGTKAVCGVGRPLSPSCGLRYITCEETRGFTHAIIAPALPSRHAFECCCARLERREALAQREHDSLVKHDLAVRREAFREQLVAQ